MARLVFPLPLPRPRFLPPNTGATLRRVFLSGGKLLIFSLLTLTAVTVGTLELLYEDYARSAPTKDEIMHRNDTGVVLLDRSGQPFFRLYDFPNKTYVPLNDISDSMKKTVLMSEDKEFYKHDGYSLRGILRAVYLNFKQKKPIYGGSTITQQLAKYTFLSPDKSLMRKYRELVIARELEEQFNKDEIFEMYLNSIYFGEGAFGVEAAAHTYFGKSAKDVDANEASLLVALLPAPSALSPYATNKDWLISRRKVILANMAKNQLITEEQKTTFAKDLPPLKDPAEAKPTNTLGIHFALLVRDYLVSQYGEQTLAHSGYTVHTTLDRNWQEQAEEVVRDQVDKLAKHTVTNGAAVVMDPTNGEVKALVGSRDWHNGDFGKVNIATSLRQPGSSFKPFLYALALEKHIITAATILHDQPTTYRWASQSYQPHDYDNRYRGPVLVRRALANSLNIPAVEVQSMVPIDETVSGAKKFGLTSLGDPKNYGLSLALGAAEVRLLDLTNGYATFANHGKRPEPILFTKIEDKYGQTVFETTPKTDQVISDETSFIISSILSDAGARKEVFGKALDVSRQAAVKTGTTSDYRDAWTVGYTPHLVIGVWVGNNDGTPMDKVAGALGPAPIWKELIERFSAGDDHDWFSQPGGVVSIDICPNGSRAEPDVFTKQPEFFLAGAEPQGTCFAPPPEPEPEPTETPPTDSSPVPVPTTPVPLLTSVATPAPSPSPNPTKPRTEPIQEAEQPAPATPEATLSPPPEKHKRRET